MSEFSTNIITISYNQLFADAVRASSMSQSSGSSDTVPDELLLPRHYLLILLSKCLFFQLGEEAIVSKIVSFVPVQREYAPMPKRMEAPPQLPITAYRGSKAPPPQLPITTYRGSKAPPAVRRDFTLPS